MKVDNKSPWMEEVHPKHKFKTLKGDIGTDILIIGAGITGLTTAYNLSKSGKKVVVIDKGVVGEQAATGFTTAFITQVVDTDLTDLEKMYGAKKAKMVWQSHQDAVDFIDKVVKREKIDCEFIRVSNFEYANSQKQFESLQEEYKRAKNFGFKVKLVDQKNSLPFRNYGYMEVKNQAKFHPLKYINALAKICKARGVDIYENTEALNIKGKNLINIKTLSGTIQTKNVVIATHAVFNNNLEMYFKSGIYFTFIMEAKVPSGVISEAMYEDFDNPYHYFRIDRKKGYDRLIIGGEDNKKIFKLNDKKNFKALDDYLKRIFPKLKYEIVHRWSGPIIEPDDGIAYIGPLLTNKNIYVATGFSGNGMTYGTISGMIIADSILGKKNFYANLYKAKRIPTAKNLVIKARDYTEEFFGGAAKNFFKSA